MDSLIASIILAIVQGITEWIPVSSTGHLILFERILGFPGTLEFDVALHFGTLMAAFVYFGKDITDIIKDFVVGKWKTANGRLAWMIIIATIPAAIVGYLFESLFEKSFSSLGVTAMGFGVTGLFLFIASLNFHKGKKSLERASYLDSLWIGLSQVIAILPGVSRSGATMSSGILRGLDEKSAARFSFLMSIPIIFGANLVAVGDKTLPTNYIWAALVSFAVGIACIHVLYRYVLTNRRNLRWFGAYALLLALALGIYILV